MSRIGLVAVVLLGAGAAFAQDAAAGASAAGMAPKVGDWQVFLEAPPLVNSAAIGGTATRGLGAQVGTYNGTDLNGFALGLNGGVGYVWSDLIEFGGALGIDYGNVGNGNGSLSEFEFALEPFVKFNLGTQMRSSLPSAKLNPFVMTGLLLGDVNVSAGGFSQSNFLFGLDIDPGVEYMMTPTWGFNLYVPLHLTDVAGNWAFAFGLEYGLVAYFN